MCWKTVLVIHQGTESGTFVLHLLCVIFQGRAIGDRLHLKSLQNLCDDFQKAVRDLSVNVSDVRHKGDTQNGCARSGG
jgi:hypothetical protein